MAYAASNVFHSIRSEMRFPTNFKAILNWEGNYAFVRVADIANTGFRVIGDYLPISGGHARIGAWGLNEAARVVWRTENACGLILERPIDALRVIRYNCFPNGRRHIGHKAPLGPIQPNVLAESLLDTFPNDESALAFLRGESSEPRGANRR